MMWSATRTIEAPAERVWELLVDTEQWPRWGPTIEAVEAKARRIELGSRGRVRTPLGIWAPFEVTEFVAERRWSWRVFGIGATEHEVRAEGDQLCEARIRMPWFAPGYYPVCKLALARIARIAERG